MKISLLSILIIISLFVFAYDSGELGFTYLNIPASPMSSALSYTCAGSSGNNGVGFLGLLGLIFVVLKLTGYIDWSWWYVTLPFWGGAALVAAIGLIWLTGWTIYKLVKVNKQA